ncbi:histidine kinase, partial [Phycicoccus sp.]|uniref:sensor histidine kinase n=1 Tax=Phycicoccus sp. TaxID=1902410 RepID=UPI002CCC7620
AVLLTGLIDPPFLAGGNITWLLTWLLVHWTLGRWTRGRAAWSAPLVVLTMTFLLLLGDSTASVESTGDVAYFLSVTAMPWLAGLVLRLREEHVAELEAENGRLEAEQAEAARRAVAEERARIARELHDVVSHAISVSILQARGARRSLRVEETEVRGALDAIEQTNTAALGDMRRLLAALRDVEDDPTTDRSPQPGLADLEALVEQVRSSGLSVRLEVEGSPASVPPGIDLSAYRIVQEALTNVLKHAEHASAEVRLRYGPDALDVTVCDTGTRRQGEPGSGLGLVGIRERVAVVGGDVRVGPVAGGGFEVAARLPFSVEPA